MVYGEILLQGQLFVQAAAIGAGMMCFYDLLRIWRRLVRHRMVGMAAEDLLFWLTCGLALFGFMYRQNDGVIRGFLILGAAVGMLAYSILISRSVIRYGTMIFGAVFRFLRFFLRLLTAPLRFFIKIMKEPLKKAGKAVRISLKKI